MPEFSTSDGVKIHYETEGPSVGPPLVFSNSLGTNLRMWDRQAEEAKNLGFRVIRYDQRGHGQSDAPAGPYTLGRLAADLAELLDLLRVDKTAFCGISMGGMTGMHLAKQHPPRFTRLALCNTAAHMAPREMWDARIKSVTEGGMEAVVEAVVERWFTPAFRKENPAEVKRIRAQILSTSPAGYAGCSAAIRDMDERDYLGLIETPALVLVGEHDPATTPEKGDYIAARIPGAQRAAIDAAHLSNVEKPEEFNRIVLGFLTGKQ